LRIAGGAPTIDLFFRSGFKESLIEQAAGRDDVRLIDLTELEQGLTTGAVI
jgi:hypothetical protein